MYRTNVHRLQHISDRQCKQCRPYTLVAQNLCFYNKNITFTLTPTSRKHARQNPVLCGNQTIVNATQAYSYLREMDISKDSHCRRHRLTSCLPKHPNRKAHSGKYRTKRPQITYNKATARHATSCCALQAHSTATKARGTIWAVNSKPASNTPPPPQSLACRPGKRSYRPKIRKRSLQLLPHHIPVFCRCPTCLSVNESRPAARRIRRIFIRRDIKNS